MARHSTEEIKRGETMSLIYKSCHGKWRVNYMRFDEKYFWFMYLVYLPVLIALLFIGR